MTLEQAWKSFRHDSIEQVRVQLRRYRASQIMAEFRDGRFRNLETFERELWKIESRTIVNGDDWTGDLYNNDAMNLEYAKELSTALDEESIELEGNYIWKHGTHKFHPQGSASTKDKERALRNIEDILISGLDPDKKVERLREVPGIGVGVASGLVMIAHPKEVAIFNSVSKSMAAAVGRHVTNYGQYQQLAIELRDRLGAKDFLELDWFLYQYNTSASGSGVGPEQMSPDDLNIIFYGPPGTGKTYRTAERAVSLIDGSTSTDRVELMERYEQLRESGQIDMVTFHQSMSYEEFVEGIRPTLGEDGDITYACEPGIFRRICQRAMLKTGATQSADLDYSDLRVWKMSLGNTKKSGDTELFAECMQENRIALGYGGTVDFSGADTKQQVEEAIRKRHDGKLPRSFAVTAVDTLKHRMQVGDLVIVSDGNHKYRAIGKITGGYEFVDRDAFCQTRPVEWLYRPDESEPREYVLHNNFSQQSIYEIGPSSIKMEGLKERLSTDSSDAPRRHVLIIDEINRGNIAKILGELMTLLEPSKRLGASDERRVTLPYSKDDFGVPPNLFVIGTMNTADRSIALLDTALRRRFRFYEMMPDCEVVRDHAAEFEALAQIDLPGLLELMNKRIEVLYDRDHMLGHAFFFKATNLVSLRDLFVAELIPLLQDYFCENWTKVGLVLGASFAIGSSASDREILEADAHDMSALFGQVDLGFEAAPRISVSKAFESAGEEELLPFFQGIWA